MLGLLAAALFGAGAPVAKLLLPGAGPVLLAGLLYLGAGAGLLPLRSRREAKLSRADVPALALVILFGGVAGPALLLWGLSRMTAVSASLLLNLEAPLTIALAVAFFGEHLARLETLGALLIICGSALLGFEPSQPSAAGALAIALACACWALDNNLTQKLSLKDPLQLVRLKSLAAGAVNLTLGFATGAALPGTRVLLGALALGAVSYGMSLVCHLKAQRALGAARQSALFATAPFVGALVAVPLLHERLSGLDFAAGALMLIGVVALVRARHGHAHTHAPLEHEHLHVHDEHHQHGHDAAAPHSHPHQHDPLTHEHPHVSDAHHRHKH
jgi:drug/metabolite transporter (DMT)-like permease